MLKVDIIMQQVFYYISPFVSLFIIYIIIDKHPFFKFRKLSKSNLYLILIIHLLFGGVNWYYFNSLSSIDSDVVNYWNDAKVIHAVSNSSIKHYIELILWNSSTEMPIHLSKYLNETNYCMKVSDYSVIRLHSFILFFSGGQIVTHIIVFCFIGFTGLCALYWIIHDCWFPKYIGVLLVFLIPSVLFWSGGMHKDGIALFCFGCLMYINLKEGSALSSLLVVFLLIGALYLFRWPLLLIYMIFIPIRLTLRYLDKIKPKLIVLFILVAVLFSISNLSDFGQRTIEKREAFINKTFGSEFLDKTPIDIEKNIFTYIIESIKHGVFVPYIWPVNIEIKYFFALENLFILMLIFYLVKDIKINTLISNKNALSFLFFLCFGSFIAIGFIVNNEYAIVRYKAQLYPIIFVSLIGALRPSKTIY